MDTLSRNAELRIIGVGDMLLDIANGLGPAHQKLWETSRTPIGTLAVKDVQIKIDFEMSSNGSHNGVSLDLPTLGAKTFSFATTSDESKQSNRATLTLNIVNVMPDKEDAELLRLLLLGVATGVGQLRTLSAEQRKQLQDLMRKIQDLIAAGNLIEARAELDQLVATYERLSAPVHLGGHTNITP